MMDVSQLLELLRRSPECEVAAPRGLPELRDGLELPHDLTEFYLECGGLLFTSSGVSVATPQRFLPINEVVLGERVQDDPSDAWYLLAESGVTATSERVCIDLRPIYRGRCYDSFWDRHGVAGSMPVVALSFRDFLTRLWEVRDVFWRPSQLAQAGDAYDE